MAQQKKYSWNASDYAKHSSAQQRWARELIEKLHLKGDESVLDIGCGDGKVTAEIASSVPRGEVVGIDNSQPMLELAQTQFAESVYPNLSFESGDAARLQYQGRFNVIFSNAALHWISDHGPVISGMRRSLKPGGRIVLQMGGRGNAASILNVMEEVTNLKKWHNYFNGFRFPYGFYGPKEYEQWLTDEGLAPVRVELLAKDMSYSSKEGLAGWIRTTWLPYTDRVPEAERTEFIDHLVESYYRAYPPDSHGAIHVGMMRLEVEAVKVA